MPRGRGNSTIRPSLGGVALVCCVHDRVKREVTDITQLQELGREIGVEYNPRKHKVHKCACCENLFVETDDEPRFCEPCRSGQAHALGGILPRPIGVVQ